MKRISILMIVLAMGVSACDFPPNLSKSFRQSSSKVNFTVVDEEKVALAETVMWGKPTKLILKRDIFKPLITSSRASSSTADKAVVANDILSLELFGTLMSENPVAYIRNTIENKNYIVHEQSMVSSFQVIKIEQKKVRLQKDGKDFYLKIPEAKK